MNFNGETDTIEEVTVTCPDSISERRRNSTSVAESIWNKWLQEAEEYDETDTFEKETENSVGSNVGTASIGDDGTDDGYYEKRRCGSGSFFWKCVRFYAIQKPSFQFG